MRGNNTLPDDLKHWRAPWPRNAADVMDAAVLVSALITACIAAWWLLA